MSRKPWNPIHAVAYGVGAGFILFVVDLFRAEAWRHWPDSRVFEKSLVLMLLLAVAFGLIAIARNRRVVSAVEDR